MSTAPASALAAQAEPDTPDSAQQTGAPEVEIAKLEQRLEWQEHGSIVWAQIQKRLADILHWQAEADFKASALETIDKALEKYDAALSVFETFGLADALAETQGNRALTLSAKGRLIPPPEGAACLDTAIKAQRGVLAHFEKQPVSENWAIAQINLGGTLYARALSEDSPHKIDMLEEAIGATTAAHRFFTEETRPSEWANTHHNLGKMRFALAKEQRSSDVKRQVKVAVHSFHNAFKYRTRKTTPVDWADTLTQSVVANAYLLQFEEDPEDVKELTQTLEQALYNVLTVYQTEVPHKCASIERALQTVSGSLHAD